MKNLKPIFLVSLFLLTACGGGPSLPDNLLENNEGYNKLIEYIYSHYSNLEEDNIEVMEFGYNGSIGAQRGELTSSIDIDFVRGDNKNRIVNYQIDNTGRLLNNNVDISVGGISNKKLSNTYETYEPYLFSNKKIDLEVLRKIVATATEEFKKDSNVENAYCSSITIKKSPDGEPQISVVIKQRKFVTDIRRSTNWTITGERIR